MIWRARRLACTLAAMWAIRRSVGGLLALLALASAAGGTASVLVDLSERSWSLSNANRSVTATAKLPAYPLEVLRAAGKLDDPLFRYGELTTRWVALDSWTFSLDFDVTEPALAPLLAAKQVLLKLDGIDTFATVSLNGKPILEADNFHRRWAVPVKSLLQPGFNTLAIAIRPAVAESLARQDAHPYTVPFIKQMGSIGAYTFARKPASDLGWDWGPAYAASGVHGRVMLLGYSHGHLDGAHMHQRKVGDAFELTVTSSLLVPPGGDEGELLVALPALKQQQSQAVKLAVGTPAATTSSSGASGSSTDAAEAVAAAAAAPDTATFSTKFVVDAASVELWWPTGYGTPTLYDVTITYMPKAAAEANGACSSSSAAGRRLQEAGSGGAAGGAHEWVFKTLSGVDLPRTSYTSKAITDQASCQEWCRVSADCQFYTYAPAPESYCWLKRAGLADGAVFGLRGLVPGHYSLHDARALKGFDLGAPTPASSVTACQEACSAVEECVGFVLQDKACQLKAAQKMSRPRVLGIKLSAPPPTAAAPPPTAPSTSARGAMQAAPTAAATPVAQPASPVKEPVAAAAKGEPAAAPADAAAVDVDPVDTNVAANPAAAAAAVKPEIKADEQEDLLNADADTAAPALAPTPAPKAADAADSTAVTADAASGAAELLDADVPASGGAAPPVACPAAAAAPTSLRYRVGFRSVELVRLPISEAVKDLFPPGQQGWDPESDYGVSKGQWDGSWALSRVTGKWDHFGSPGNGPDVEGESFYFKVNGVPIYIKGANLVPLHVLPTNVTSDMIADLLQYALDSNMNMIRIWGGGMYPTDELFRIADERGLLVWMETMFACAPYPRNPEFLDNVAAEVTQQVRRLSWHPSVAVWAGNNEIEGSFNWYSETRSNKQLFTGDYIALFIDTIKNIIRANNPSIAFVDSSPSNGVIVDNERQYIKRWGEDWDPRYGDIHFYAYDDDCEDFSTYPKAKFVSEFGSQSFPTFATYAEATSLKDWQVDNPMTGFRNRRFGNGLEMFEKQFKRHFRLPQSWSAPDDPQAAFKLFRSFFYITHMQQARCYETGINYWRRLRSHPPGLTMGVLYWQLNDIAQYASWSAYDFGGRWKPLAYTIKRIFAPLAVQAVKDGNVTKVFLTNDHTAAVDATITVKLLSLADSAAAAASVDGSSPSACAASSEPPLAEFNYVVPPGFASLVWSMRTEELLASRKGCSATSCYVSVTAAGAADESDEIETSEAQLWLVPLRELDLPDPGLSLSNFRALPAAGAATTSNPSPMPGGGGASATPAAPAPIAFTLSASRPALLTTFVTKLKGRFSDDALTALHPCSPKEVTFFPKPGSAAVTAEGLRAGLAVESLFNHQFGTAASARAEASEEAKPRPAL